MKMPAKNHDGAAKKPDHGSGCAPEPRALIIEKVLRVIGGKWKVLIVFHLATNEVCRFGELRRKIPDVTQKMLTAALREMEADGLVERTVYAEVPPRVEYRLSKEGSDLQEVYCALAAWGFRHEGFIDCRYGARTESGHDVEEGTVESTDET